MKNIESYAARVNGSIMLNANECYKNISGEIVKELAAAIGDLAMNRYPDEASTELIEAYAKVKKLSADRLLAGNGSDEMLGLMIGYFLGKGKKLLTLSPDFSMYDYYASMHESEVVKFPCEKDGAFSIADFIEFGREYHVDMVLFSNPNNPTGHFVSNADVRRIVEAFPRIPVIIDEAYGEFAKESMLEYLDTYPNLYVIRTLSKAFGFAGARLGFLISNPGNIAALRPYMVPYNISCLTQKAGVIILQHAAEYELLVEEVQLERDMLYHKLKQLKNVTFYPSQANYLYGRSKQKQQLLEALHKEGIVIRDYEGKDSFRITVGSPGENAIVLSVLQEFDRKVCVV